MKDAIAFWHAEHAHFARLLNLFEKELAAYHEGEQPNYELMRDIVFYLRHYPDRFHHPREDAVFARMVRHDPSLRAKVNRLLQEHRVISQAGDQLLDRLDQVLGDAMVSREALEAAAATYLVYYRHHLNTEERDMLPRAGELLSDAEWKEAAASIPHGHDPLFGDHPEERFKELRRQIIREAG